MLKRLFHKISGRRNGSVHGIRPANLARTIRFHVESGIESFRVLQFGGEEEYLARFIGELRPADVVWDVGASIGLYGISAAVAAAEGQVFSFEPDPRIASRLRANGALNHLQNLHVVECAVSDKQETVTLFTDGIDGFSPSLQKQSRPGAATGQITVQAVTLDFLRESGRIPAPTVVKIDIEGAEYLALNGMKQTLNLPGKPRVVFLELHPEFLKTFGATAQDCEALLEQAGYSIDLRVARDNETLLILRAN